MHKKLYDHISELQLKASTLYEFWMGQKVKPEIIVDKIAPLSGRLHDLIENSAVNNPSGCAEAIVMYDNFIKGYESDIKYFEQKILDSRKDQRRIKLALMNRMKAEGIEAIEESGYMILWVTKDGREDIVVQ